MATDITIPDMGESVSEGVIARWFKEDGDSVDVDEPILELETDKASMELPSEVAGRLEIVVQQGETVTSGTVVGRVHPSEEKGEPAKARERKDEKEPAGETGEEAGPEKEAAKKTAAERKEEKPAEGGDSRPLSPAVRRLVEEHDLDPASIEGTGKGGRLLKEDVLRHMEGPARPEVKEADREAPKKAEPAARAEPATGRAKPAPGTADEPETERVPMTTLRRRIAERLVEAQQQAAILTTFNDVDCSAILALRRQYRERFEKKYGIGLGFMSLFGRASISAMVEVPGVNAAIDGTDIVYHHRVHLGIAVSTERGLVVPVVRNADRLSLAELERSIDDMARRARDRKLGPDELTGGTFSITNGGVFGSMLSTPLLNPPQSAILGMHRIEERPVVRDGAVVVRPMMYLALSYDHRLIDGREAVTYLRNVKERLEDPARMILEV